MPIVQLFRRCRVEDHGFGANPGKIGEILPQQQTKARLKL
jgi:hypothetical protein